MLNPPPHWFPPGSLLLRLGPCSLSADYVLYLRLLDIKSAGLSFCLPMEPPPLLPSHEQVASEYTPPTTHPTPHPMAPVRPR